MTPFPSARRVEEATPPGRDRVLDLVRICSLLVVVTAHAAMAVVLVEGSGEGTELRLDNLLGVHPGLQALTWALQVLPLFFFAGAAASAIAWTGDPDRRPASWGGWLLGRVQRLYRPLVVYVLVWAAALAISRPLLPDGVWKPVAGVSTQLAWFLGVYVLVLAFVPLLARIRSGRGLVGTLVGLAGAVALVDVLRLAHVVPSAVGSVNFVLAWLVPAALGVGYVRGLLAARPALLLAGAAFCADVALVAFTPYQLSLVTVPGQVISNMTPPSVVVVGHSLVVVGLVVAARGRLARTAA